MHTMPGPSQRQRVLSGAQPTAEGFTELKKMGVKTVVNLRSFHSDRRKLRGTGLRYAHIYCKAWHPEDEDTVDPFIHVVATTSTTGTVIVAGRGRASLRGMFAR